jgi:hypothetical protein
MSRDVIIALCFVLGGGLVSGALVGYAFGRFVTMRAFLPPATKRALKPELYDLTRPMRRGEPRAVSDFDDTRAS